MTSENTHQTAEQHLIELFVSRDISLTTRSSAHVNESLIEFGETGSLINPLFSEGGFSRLSAPVEQTANFSS